jgi:glycosyltransferase involved in cell wall biosynthesis
VFTIVIYIFFILAVLLQFGYALFFFRYLSSIPVNKIALPVEERQPVSIIICAKNEAANLKKNLPAILAQRYSNESGIALYEVIVVNDASTDETEQVLNEMELHYDNLWDVVIPPDTNRDLQGKKFALSKGLAYAGNEWLLLTDADCAPASNHWLELMVAPLAKGKEIVAGYGAYNKSAGFLNAFIRWETIHTFLQYSTYALAGNPYMAVGRNLACTKKALQKAQASDRWNAVPSGDDDMLVNIAGNKENTAIVASEAAFTYTDAKNTFNDWIKQKQRHLSTGKYYNENIKLLLATYACSHALLWLCFFELLAFHRWKIALICMAVRSVAYWMLWIATAKKLNEKSINFTLPFFDMAWMMYNFALYPYITRKNKKQWT